jgi:hypothetical protein
MTFFSFENFLRKIARALDALADRFAFCPDCGRNRYTGKSCVG